MSVTHIPPMTATPSPVPGAPDLTIEGDLEAAFEDEAITGSFVDQPYTVFFRPEVRFDPMIIEGSDIEVTSGPSGTQVYTVWGGGGSTRKIVGLFNASEIVGIVRGFHRPQAAV